ncbi:MAG: hypothetical protein AB1461_00730 [Thermodesulfobacteriota bacterium]
MATGRQNRPRLWQGFNKGAGSWTAMPVLVDTSVWIEYFRPGNNLDTLDFLIDENLVVTNDLILAALIPFLKVRKQSKIISLLRTVTKLPTNINWEQISEFQYQCLKNGILHRHT